ncbi:HEPN domain-containing protein [Bernardetia sp. ABR2-2B]|uniref:HEPN domain-containing protein n=1 Tax=Bernardetia sp. ABR2-2B TaxID=3127472 RepID=UPI0030CE2E7D
MSHLKKKSKDNLKAAQKLIDEGFYASSIHCSYYSCLQFIKFIYIEDEDFITDCNNKEKNSHNIIINKVLDEICEKADYKEEIRINKFLQDLKKTRVDADYNEVEITEEEAKFALLNTKHTLSDIKFILDI